MRADADELRDAVISDCGRYRYTLTRTWSTAPAAVFIMLNPSTADARVDDRTIGRVRDFSKRFGCGGFTVVNLFAFRATKPVDMMLAHDPVGPQNDAILMKHAQTARLQRAPVIAAWGALPFAATRAAEIAALFPDMSCLGVTASGAPRHPLYIKGDAPVRSWPTRDGADTVALDHTLTSSHHAL